jgi:hypothetical protein
MGVMLITSLQMKICSDNALMQMIEKVALFNVKNDSQKLERDRPNRAWWQKACDGAIFATYSLLPIFLMLFIFSVSITKISLFGLLILLMGLILLWRAQDNYWRNSYHTIGPLALLAILLKVAFDFVAMVIFTGINPKIDQKQKNVLSLVFGFQYFPGTGGLGADFGGGQVDDKVLSGIFYLYILLSLCLLSKYLSEY